MKKQALSVVLSTFLFFTGFNQLCADQYPAYTSYDSNTGAKIAWQPNYNGAVSLARTTSKPILILFTGTNWCPACMKLEREVLTKPEFARTVGDKFVFLKAEFPSYTAESIHASPYKFLLDRYQVDSFPTMIVIDVEGNVLFTVNYQAGGPDAYANELLNKLNQYQKTSPAPTYSY